MKTLNNKNVNVTRSSENPGKITVNANHAFHYATGYLIAIFGAVLNISRRLQNVTGYAHKRASQHAHMRAASSSSYVASMVREKKIKNYKKSAFFFLFF